MTQELDKKIITPKEAAAAMMHFTMRSIESHWSSIQPVLLAYLHEATMSEAQEDELIREIYLAALALEILALPHYFAPDVAGQIGAGMDEVMHSPEFAHHRLSEPICTAYVPQFHQVDQGLGLGISPVAIDAATAILYDRLQLPLKPTGKEKNLLWLKLQQFLPQVVGKWPILTMKFTVSSN